MKTKKSKKAERQQVRINAVGLINGVIYCHCPKCGQDKPIDEFGIRTLKRGTKRTVRNQSWCRHCRGFAK